AIAILVPASLVAAQTDLSHIIYGALFFALLCLVIASENPVARILGWRPLVALGTMSYSLYLVHQPIIQLLALWLQVRRPDLSPTAVFLALILFIPVILLLAWMLFVLVERRTMGPSAGALFFLGHVWGWWSVRLPQASLSKCGHC